MAFTGTTYVNVSGATTAAAGQTVQSAVWDNIHVDLGNALTQVYSQVVAIISYKNLLYANGGAEVWQRTNGGTSATMSIAASTTAYTLDRWYIVTGLNQAHTISAATPLSNGSQIAANVQRQNGQTGTTAMVFGYPLELVELVRVRGNKVSLSGIISAGANWSPSSGTLVITVYAGTGAAGKRSAGPYTNETVVLSISTNLTPGGAAVAFSGQSTVIVPTNTTQLEVQFSWTPVGTAGAADSFQFDDIQLESNLSSQTWAPNQFDRIPFEISIVACKRQFQKTFNYNVAPAQASGVTAGSMATIAGSQTQIWVWWPFEVEMRANPTVTLFNVSVTTSAWRDTTLGVDVGSTVDAPGSNSQKGVLIIGVTVTASSVTDKIYIQAQADAGL